MTVCESLLLPKVLAAGDVGELEAELVELLALEEIELLPVVERVVVTEVMSAVVLVLVVVLQIPGSEPVGTESENLFVVVTNLLIIITAFR